MHLRDYMAENNLDDAETAAWLGCSKGAIIKLRKFERKPSLSFAMRIFRATDGRVGLADWFADGHPTTTDNTLATADT